MRRNGRRGRRMGEPRTRAVLAALLALVVTAGCASPTSPSLDGGPTGPIDVTDAEVSVSDGYVTSRCYSFELPDGYEASEGGSQCSTALSAIGSERVDIYVFPDTEYATMDEFLAGVPLLFSTEETQEVTSEQISLRGRPTAIVAITRTDGLQSQFLYISIEPETFAADGVPVPAIAFSFVGYDSSAVDAADRALDTLEIFD